MRGCTAFILLSACGARTDLGSRISATDASAHDAAHDAPVDAPTIDAPVVDVVTPNDCGALLASGPSWQTPFGPAQPVCLNPSSPTNCPSNAVIYGGGSGWGADLSSIGPAEWVWRPNISGSDPSDNVQVVFTRTFVLTGVPSGSISIAVDDEAEIRVNGFPIGIVGSTTNSSQAAAAQNALATFDISAHLVAGANLITVIGNNGPASFAGCSGACTYEQNPAGVVFGGRVDCN